jgi:hypothetical protein
MAEPLFTSREQVSILNAGCLLVHAVFTQEIIMQRIQFLQIAERTRSALRPYDTRLTPSGKVLWLQRILLDILSKLGCVDEKQTTCEYKVLRIEVAGLEKFILTQLHHTRMRDIDVEMIVIGNDYFRELVVGNTPQLSINSVVDIRHPSAFGFPLRVVPWFEGAVVIPKTK